jgi:Leucine-rich repeat (LRR) protein
MSMLCNGGSPTSTWENISPERFTRWQKPWPIPEQVVTLDLSRQNLRTLPADIGKLKNLERLYLAENQLSSLPPEVQQLTRLQYLDLIGNPIPVTERSKIQQRLPSVEIEFNQP